MDQPTTFEQGCNQIARELAELVIKKQKDYGKDNIKAFGERGILVRANDKVARLRNLLTISEMDKEGVTEPRIDSWFDLGGYSLLALMLDRGWFDLPLEGE